jgi:glutamate N-acetyltransferase/amino-acid N-acetyltransferase
MELESYQSEEEYFTAVKKRSELPAGFRCSTTSFRFFPFEKPVEEPLPMNMSLVLADEATASFGAVFTRNRFPGAPVIIGKKRCAQPYIRGICINNKIANVCTLNGVEDAESLLEELGKFLGIAGSLLIPASTGIIGWQLPLKEMTAALSHLVDGLSNDSLFPVARAIMTTDSFPKVRSAPVGGGLVTATAKGAGMIEPNMATLLIFILTDVQVEREALRRALFDVVEETFNRISIDSDQSTSDTAIIISSNKKPSPGSSVFRETLFNVCSMLAEDIVRNGEGTSHVVRVMVKGIADKYVGTGIGKSVINSPLVKTAIFGNDANVGRIISAIGDYLGNNSLEIGTEDLVIKVGGIVIFSARAFRIDAEKEKRLAGYMKDARLDTSVKGYPAHNRTVDIELEFGSTTPVFTVTGSDLTYEYVRENADYRS